MPIQYADKSYQPGEFPLFSMTFTPGKAIATGDTLTGTPTVTIRRMSDNTNVTSNVVGPPAITGVLQSDPAPALVGNIVSWKIGNMVDGEDYACEIEYDTTLGEENMNEVLVVSCREFP